MDLPGFPPDAAAELENAMRKLISGRDLPLYRMMAFHLGWVDENGEPVNRPTPDRLHGAVCLAAAQAASGSAASQAGGPARGAYARALGHAAAVELVHNFWQIHVDVEDGNTERDGRSSIWWTWGPAQAINTGDGMHAISRLMLFGLKDDGFSAEQIAASLNVLDEATLRLCEGEYLDIAYQERLGVTVEQYLEMCEARTGSLLGCAAQLGAIASGAGRDRAAALARFGQKLGAAGQVAADIALLWPQGQRDPAQQGRLVGKKKNLPVLHAMAHGDPRTRRRLGDLYVQRVLDPNSIDAVTGMLEACGSRRYAEETLTRLEGDAAAALSSAGLGKEAEELMRAAGRIVMKR